MKSAAEEHSKTLRCRLLHVLLTHMPVILFSSSIYIKSLILIGIMMNKKHSWINFLSAFKWSVIHVQMYMPPIIIIAALSYFIAGKKRIWFLISINILISAIFLGDIWYYRAFSSFPTPVVLKQTANLNNLSDSVMGIMRAVDIFFVLDLLFHLPSAIHSKHKNLERRPLPAFIMLFFCTLTIFVPVFSAHRNNIEYFSYPRIALYDQSMTVFSLSPLYYHIYSAYDYSKNTAPLKLSAKDSEDIESWFDENQENIPDNAFKGLFAGKNLIVIKAESLERFVIHQRIGGAEITPNINHMISNSIDFPGMHEQVRDGNSSDAELMINASIYPLRRGSTVFMYPYAPYRSTLPKLLEEKGYSSLAAHADHGSFWNWVASLSSIGYNQCFDISRFINDDFLVFGLSDRSFLKQMVPNIIKRKKPFLVYVSTMSAHIPYKLPKNLCTLRIDKYLQNTPVGDYLNAVHYMDEQIGYFTKLLDENNLLDDTVIVVFGDHEGLHKYYADTIENISPRENWWYKNDKKSVFIIYKKGMTPYTCGTTGGQIDALPTLAYLFGIDGNKYERSVIGRNLLKTSRNFVLDSDGTVKGTSDLRLINHALKGFEVSEKIIRSGYYKLNDEE